MLGKDKINNIKKIKAHTIIVAYHALPHTSLWGAAQRMHYLSEHLIENNHNVTVISADFGVSDSSGKERNYKTIGVKIKPKFIQKYQESLQNTQSDSMNISNASDNLDLINKIKSYNSKIVINFIKYLYLYFEKIFFNDFANYGFLCYLWEIRARKIVSNEIDNNNTKVIIISGPYFGSFSMIRYIKKNYKNIKVILDYRDPWNLLNSSSFLSLIKEKKFLSIADHVVMFSDLFKYEMIKFFKLPEKKCITMYNGFDSDLWDEIDKSYTTIDNISPNKFVISYVSSNISFKKGTPRDPMNLIKAVSKIKDSKNIKLNIIGCVDGLDFFEKLNFDFELNILPFVPHKEAITYLKNSNIVVILSTELTTSKYTLTGKLFDCIRSGNFVLGISNSSNVDYKSLIEEMNIGACCTNDITEIHNVLEYQYDIWNHSDYHNSFIDKEIYSRRNQNKKLISILNSYN